MRRALCALALAAMTAGPAAAQTPDDLYNAGKYEEAIAAGTAANTPQGLEAATHAAFVEAVLKDKPCLECLQRAEALARRAIASDPARPDPHVYLAGILGYEGRIIGMVSAKLKGYPEEAKSEIDTALSHDPDDARALAARGGWNLAIVSAGGATMADWIYGAGVDQGMADFAKALKLSPGDVSLRFQYALSLSSLDRDAYHEDILAALQHTQGDNPRSAYDKIAQKRALVLLALLKANKTDEYDATVRKFEGYP